MRREGGVYNGLILWPKPFKGGLGIALDDSWAAFRPQQRWLSRWAVTRDGVVQPVWEKSQVRNMKMTVRGGWVLLWD